MNAWHNFYTIERTFAPLEQLLHHWNIVIKITMRSIKDTLKSFRWIFHKYNVKNLTIFQICNPFVQFVDPLMLNHLVQLLNNYYRFSINTNFLLNLHSIEFLSNWCIFRFIETIFGRLMKTLDYLCKFESRMQLLNHWW